MGGTRARGCALPRVSNGSSLQRGVRAAYGDGATSWAGAPDRIYRRLAGALVTACPASISGARVLDFGAGTGATSAAIVAAGGVVVAADLSPSMLGVRRAERPPAVASDVYALPFRAATFDLAMGAFVVSHLPDPTRGLAEVARTVRPDGHVMTLGFDERWSFAAKSVVEETLQRFGYRRPDWYTEFKADVEPLAALPDRLVRLASSAGLHEVRVSEHSIDTGVRTAHEIIEWRLASPGYAAFAASLDVATHDRVVQELSAALGSAPEPLVPSVLVMSGLVPR